MNLRHNEGKNTIFYWIKPLYSLYISVINPIHPLFTHLVLQTSGTTSVHLNQNNYLCNDDISSIKRKKNEQFKFGETTSHKNSIEPHHKYQENLSNSGYTVMGRKQFVLAMHVRIFVLS